MERKRGRMNKNSPFKKSPGGKMNKRGAEMTIGTIIVIILALVVLVVIIYGFVTGWGNLWSKIIGLGGGGKVNVQTNVDSCKLACTSDAQSDYCLKKRAIIFEDGGPAQNLTCNQLVTSQGPSIGLEPCVSIDCNVVNPSLPGKACVDGWSGQWSDKACTTLNSGSVIYMQMDNSLILQTDVQDPANAGKNCCVQLKTCSSWYPSNIVCSSLTRYDITKYLTSAEKTAKPGQVCCAE